MKRNTLLSLIVLLGFGSNQLTASDNSIGMTNWVDIAKAVGQLSGFVYLSNEYVKLESKKELTRSCRYKHGFEKLWFLLGGSLLAASITHDWPLNMKRVALLTGLVGATHTFANNNNTVRGLRKVPFAGTLLTDPEDSNGYEQTSLGAITRYACTYMALRSLLLWATKDTHYDLSDIAR